MKRNWILPSEVEKEKYHLLSKKLNLSSLLIQTLHNRGIKEENIQEFLNPRLENLCDPFLMKGMDLATERILRAISHREKILIYGDYDVDGISATSILLLFLRQAKVAGYFYIPHREKEGYGLNRNAVKKAHDKGIDLIITCDCGSSSFEEIEYAKDLGVDVIVTDHHQIRGSLFPSCITLNPNQPDCPYPFKELAGVGVVFKLVQALAKKPGMREIDPYQYLDLVAMGTIADVVPLRGENRILAKHGLASLKRTSNWGLRALLSVGGLSGEGIDETRVGFVLAPRLNACGRLSLAQKGVKLLLSTSSREAFGLARDLDRDNGKRQRIAEKMRREAEELLPSHKGWVIVLAKRGWHPGVIGLVASYIRKKYFRPVVILSPDGDTARGSARSIPKFSIFEGLENCQDLLLSFGGHRMAAGMKLPVENIPELERRLNYLASQTLSSEDLTPSYSVDARVNLEELDERLFENLELLSPYGPQNPAPLFLAEDVYFSSPLRKLSRGCLRTSLSSKKGGEFEAVAFSLENQEKILEHHPIMVIFTPRITRFRNKRSHQLEIMGWKERGEDEGSIQKNQEYTGFS
ncbi:Single-stranded-DNA-specific exonuclease RecJ [subsurface metagenome]